MIRIRTVNLSRWITACRVCWASELSCPRTSTTAMRCGWKERSSLSPSNGKAFCKPSDASRRELDNFLVGSQSSRMYRRTRMQTEHMCQCFSYCKWMLVNRDIFKRYAAYGFCHDNPFYLWNIILCKCVHLMTEWRTTCAPFKPLHCIKTTISIMNTIEVSIISMFYKKSEGIYLFIYSFQIFSVWNCW